MKSIRALGLTVATIVSTLSTVAAFADQDAESCDRACLSSLADLYLRAVEDRDPARLPLARTYRATENGVAAGIPMMNVWSTARDIGDRYYIIDPVSGQLFFIAELVEGDRYALYFGRLKVVSGAFEELETYIARSRSDGGYQYAADRVGSPAPQWLEKVERSRIPTRAQLLEWGKATFDTGIATPPTDPACLLMENGKVVEEDSNVADFVSNAGKREQAEKAMVNIPCGQFPDRPTDPLARTTIIDEEQGIVVSMAVLQGTVQPSLVEDPTISAFVPDAILPPYLDLLEKWQGTERARLPAIEPMAATVQVAELHRYYDGKLQGQYLLLNLAPPGALSPWVRQAK